MESVALKARDRGQRRVARRRARRAGRPPGDEAPLRFDVPVGPGLRLLGRGPALFAEDQRVLDAFAAAARTAYEGRVLSGEAEQARSLAVVDQQRTSLLAAVGHDLRTPLAGIKAAVSSLRQTDVEWSDEERGELLATIEDSADRLDAWSRNLLDASRLQTGSLSVRARAGGARRGGRRGACSRFPDAAERVTVDVAEDLPLVHADPGLLQRVLVNVLDNALRHGAGAARSRSAPPRAATSAKLEVIDHGPGVPERARERLFEPFQRLDDARPEGVGLGPAGRARLRRGDGRRAGRRQHPGRRPDDAHPPAAGDAAGRSDDARPGRRGRARPAQGARDQPAGARLRGGAGRRRRGGADRRRRAIRPTR